MSFNPPKYEYEYLLHIYIIYNMCMSINTMMYIFTNKTKPCNTWSQIESICFIAYISPVHFPKSFTSCLPILKSCHVSSNYPPPFHHDGGRIPWMMCKKKHQSTGTIQLTPDGSGESVATSDGKNHNKTTTTRNAREKNKGKKNKHEDTKKKHKKHRNSQHKQHVWQQRQHRTMYCKHLTSFVSGDASNSDPVQSRVSGLSIPS